MNTKTLDPISVLTSLSNSIPNLLWMASPPVPQFTLTWYSTAGGLKPSTHCCLHVLPAPVLVACVTVHPALRILNLAISLDSLQPLCWSPPHPAGPDSCRHHASALASNAPRHRAHCSQPSQPLTFTTKSLSPAPIPHTLDGSMLVHGTHTHPSPPLPSFRSPSWSRLWRVTPSHTSLAPYALTNPNSQPLLETSLQSNRPTPCFLKELKFQCTPILCHGALLPLEYMLPKSHAPFKGRAVLDPSRLTQPETDDPGITSLTQLALGAYASVCPWG